MRSRAMPTAAPPTDASPRPRSAASRTSSSRAACNSVGNAGCAAAAAQFVTVTHPFHPYSGQQGECVARRGNRSGKRWLLRFADGRICAVPPQWTDATTTDLELAVGAGRALCNLTDLLELAELVGRLMSQRRVSEPKGRKVNYTALVKGKTPQKPWSLR